MMLPHVLVAMNQYACTSADDAYYRVVSVGAADCIIVVAYQETTKKLLMCHVDRSTDVRKLAAEITRFVGTPTYIILASDIFKLAAYTANGNHRDLLAVLPQNVMIRRIGTRNIEFDAKAGRFWVGPMAGETARVKFSDVSVEMPNISLGRDAPPERVYPRTVVVRTSAKGSKESPF